MSTQYRNVCFTLNNYTADEEKKIQEFDCKYLVYGREKGQNNTPHLQGYVELTKRLTLKPLKLVLGNRAHVEKRKGTAEQAATYCKKDKDIFEKGTISAPGARNDIKLLLTAVKKRKRVIELAEEYPVAWVKYHRACEKLSIEYAREDKEPKQVTVTVLYGKAGSGKTRRAYEMDPDLYMFTESAGQDWFDGYHGQKTILFDDFYGGIKYGKFLKLLDRYRFNLAVKGGFTWKSWTQVIITSNQRPDEWYSRGMTPALLRRLDYIYLYPLQPVRRTPNQSNWKFAFDYCLEELKKKMVVE